MERPELRSRRLPEALREGRPQLPRQSSADGAAAAQAAAQAPTWRGRARAAWASWAALLGHPRVVAFLQLMLYRPSYVLLTAVCCSYIAGLLGLSLVWCAVLVAAGNSVLQKIYARALRESLRKDREDREAKYPHRESAAWVNNMLVCVYGNHHRYISHMFVRWANPLLNQLCTPPPIEHLAFKKLDIGQRAPRLSNVVIHNGHGSPPAVMKFDFDVHYESDFRGILESTLKKTVFPVYLSTLFFACRMRFELAFVQDRYPFIRSLRWVLLDRPVIDIKVKATGLPDMMEMPMVTDYFLELVIDYMCEQMLFPKFVEADFEAAVGLGEVESDEGLERERQKLVKGLAELAPAMARHGDLARAADLPEDKMDSKFPVLGVVSSVKRQMKRMSFGPLRSGSGAAAAAAAGGAGGGGGGSRIFSKKSSLKKEVLTKDKEKLAKGHRRSCSAGSTPALLQHIKVLPQTPPASPKADPFAADADGGPPPAADAVAADPRMGRRRSQSFDAGQLPGAQAPPSVEQKILARSSTPTRGRSSSTLPQIQVQSPATVAGMLRQQAARAALAQAEAARRVHYAESEGHYAPPAGRYAPPDGHYAGPGAPPTIAVAAPARPQLAVPLAPQRSQAQTRSGVRLGAALEADTSADDDAAPPRLPPATPGTTARRKEEKERRDREKRERKERERREKEREKREKEREKRERERLKLASTSPPSERRLASSDGMSELEDSTSTDDAEERKKKKSRLTKSYKHAKRVVAKTAGYASSAPPPGP